MMTKSTCGSAKNCNFPYIPEYRVGERLLTARTHRRKLCMCVTRVCQWPICIAASKIFVRAILNVSFFFFFCATRPLYLNKEGSDVYIIYSIYV